MCEFIMKSNQIPQELWPAIIAKLTAGNPAQAEEFNKSLDKLPADKRDFIVQSV